MQVVAHRGFSARFPENTALAFEKAILVGADIIETDLRLTRDGKAICSHDADLGRIAGVRKLIAESTLAELKSARLPEGQSLLALDEVLAIARGKVRVLLDIKVESAAMLAAILETTSEAAMVSDVVCGVRSPAFLHAVRARHNSLSLLAMPSSVKTLGEFLGDDVGQARLWEEDVDSGNVERVLAAGLGLWVTAGFRSRGESPGHITAERLERLRAYGANAVLVNDVELAINHRQAHQPAT
ncbi:MAG: glycerophosphodiester phosphodiesterase [Betaproteobacteria bacterium]